MWIIFVHLKQRYIMQFTGDETMKDIKNIFCELYGYSDKINFTINDHPSLSKMTEKPLKEILGPDHNDYCEISVTEPDGNLNEKNKHTGPVKLNKCIAIGDKEKDGRPISERSTSSRRRSSVSSPSSDNKKVNLEKK